MKKATLLGLAFIALGGVGSHAQAQHADTQTQQMPGTLVTSFGNNGSTKFKVGLYENRDTGGAVALTADGKILLGGQMSQVSSRNDYGRDYYFVLYRFNADGSLDKTFGVNGLVAAKTAPGVVTQLVVQEDGSILAAGEDLFSDGGLTLVKFSANGALDKSFGNGGVLIHHPQNHKYVDVSGLTVQRDGSILIAGNASSEWTLSPVNMRAFLLKVDRTGKVDNNFLGTRKVILLSEFSAVRTISDLMLDEQGNILLSGVSDYAQYETGEKVEYRRPYVARLLANGELDFQFGKQGVAEYSNQSVLGWEDEPQIAVREDGHVLQLLTAYTSAEKQRVEAWILDYRPDGSLNTSFGSGGAVKHNFRAATETKGIFNLVGETYFLANVGQTEDSYPESPTLFKLNSAGQLDTNFSYDGKLGVSSLEELLNPLTTNDGKILITSRLLPFRTDIIQDYEKGSLNVEFVKVNP